jgi:hypothetical protein
MPSELTVGASFSVQCRFNFSPDPTTWTFAESKRTMTLTETPPQGGRASEQTFDRNPSGCPLPSLETVGRKDSQ